MSRTTLRITGMTCEHCKEAVEKALKKMPGARDISVDRFAGSATLEWDDTRASRDDLVAAVNELGFKAE